MTALTLGTSRVGPPPRLKIDGPGGTRHLLVAGTTGSGKGSWMKSVLGAAAVRPDVQVLMVDPKAIDSAPWAPRLSALAVDPQDIHALSKMVDVILDDRTHVAASRGWDEWQPSPAEPTLVFACDELAQAMKVASFKDVLDKTLHLGRALGVAAVAATQQANASAVGSTELRSLFSCRAALYDAEAAGYVFTFGKDVVSRYTPDAFGWLRYDRPGLAAWADGTGAPWLARAYQWTRGDVAQVVEATRHLTVPLARLMPEGVYA